MPGGLAPNGSVRWFIEALKPQKDAAKGTKWRLDGKDDTKKGDFLKVVIQMPSDPANRTNFINQLREQLTKATAPGTDAVTFYMPLEDSNNGYAPGEGNRPLQSDNMDVELGEDDWQVYFDWSKTKSDLPSNLQNGWRYPDQSPI